MIYFSLHPRALKRYGIALLVILFVFTTYFYTESMRIQPVIAPAATRETANITRHAPTSDKVVALTFEISWGEVVPKQVLEVLKREKVRATFFVHGAWAQSHPDFIQSLFAGGHDIGTMGMRPVDWRDVENVVLREQVEQSTRVVEQIIGHKPLWVRPPSGQLSKEAAELLAEMQLQVILWDVDAQDWARPGMDYIIQRVYRQLHPGAFIRLQASDSAQHTAEALTGLIQTIRQEGYELQTVSQLLARRSRPEGENASPQ